MSQIRYDQSNFTAGQIDPKVFARYDYGGYAKGCRLLRNAFVIPQGGFRKRFGTTYVATADVTDADSIDLYTLVYNDNIVYLLVFQPLTIKIYIENTLCATVVSPYNAEDIVNIRASQNGTSNDMVVVDGMHAPRLLVRTDNSAVTITGVNTTLNTLTVATTPSQTILPITFTTTGALPTTSPQIYPNRVYFSRRVDGTNFQIYSSTEEAGNEINPFQVTAAGSGTNSVIFENTWTFNAISFTFKPSFDFGPSYTAITFTPSAVTGSTTLTASSTIFTAELVGGVFQGGGGAMRITGFTNGTTVTGDVQNEFNGADPIPGSLAYLAAPAWSDTRGWPRAVSFYQSRLVLGGSAGIPNGVWLSVTNEGNNFDDIDTVADSAITTTATSGLSNYVKAFTSTESLIVHTNTSSFSNSATQGAPVTPSNFYLSEQNRDGLGDTPPVHIDNQIIYLDRSNNSIKNLQYDIIQSKYVLNNISLQSSVVINRPVDMSGFSDPQFTDGSFVFIVNSDGTMAIYQSLIEQEISGWSICSTKQSNGPGYFLRVANGLDRAWFAIKRRINNEDVIYLEELDFERYTDCAIHQTNVGSNVVTGLGVLEGQSVQVLADGFYKGHLTVLNGQITLPESADDVIVGLRYLSEFSPLPVTFQLPNGSTFYEPRHIRTLYVNYYEAWGVYVNNTEIPTTDMRRFVLGQKPTPNSGVYVDTPMLEWDPFDPYAEILTITSGIPFPMTILGIGYVLEV